MTCSLCRLDAPGELVNAGGDLGLVHRGCFVEYDIAQEAEEHFSAGWEVYLGGNRAARKAVVEKVTVVAVPPPPRKHRTRLEQQIETARRRLAAHGIHVEAA